MSETYNIGEHIVKMTEGPVEGMTEITLTLMGKGWALTYMEPVTDPEGGEFGGEGSFTTIVLSK